MQLGDIWKDGGTMDEYLAFSQWAQENGCLFARNADGDFELMPMPVIQKSDEQCALEAREKRNQLIAETDYLVMPDYPLDDGKKAAVLAYRQALRDVPEQAGFPRQIDWPVKP